MPDDWERATGSNPSLDDAMKMMPDGYAALEHYLDWLGGYHAKTAAGAAVTVDLSRYAAGFSDAAPIYAVSDSLGGSAVLASDGRQVRFIPAAGFSGVAAFRFILTGKVQSSYSASVAVLFAPGATDGIGPYSRRIRGSAGGPSSPLRGRDIEGRKVAGLRAERRIPSKEVRQDPSTDAPQ